MRSANWGVRTKAEPSHAGCFFSKFKVQRLIVLEESRLENYSSNVKTLNAHFDGKVVVLDEPADLKPNDKVKVIAPERDDAVSDFARLSEPAFQKIWDNPLDADYDKL